MVGPVWAEGLDDAGNLVAGDAFQPPRVDEPEEGEVVREDDEGVGLPLSHGVDRGLRQIGGPRGDEDLGDGREAVEEFCVERAQEFERQLVVFLEWVLGVSLGDGGDELRKLFGDEIGRRREVQHGAEEDVLHALLVRLVPGRHLEEDADAPPDGYPVENVQRRGIRFSKRLRLHRREEEGGCEDGGSRFRLHLHHSSLITVEGPAAVCGSALDGHVLLHRGHVAGG